MPEIHEQLGIGIIMTPPGILAIVIVILLLRKFKNRK